MTDYKEEQAHEIEALESIYPEELTLVSTKPYHCFQITINSQSDAHDVENATCVLQFTYTASYPDEAPIMEIAAIANMDEEHQEMLLALLKEQAEENLGMVMVFTLVSAAQEKMTDLVEDIAREKEEAEDRKVQAREEAERKKFEGTRVTIESFLAWKSKFDAELRELSEKKGKIKEQVKLTGKELFMQDSTLDDSDVKFLEEEGDSVQVDESLFQDLEDLDLDEGGLDDLDFEDESGAVAQS